LRWSVVAQCSFQMRTWVSYRSQSCKHSKATPGPHRASAVLIKRHFGKYAPQDVAQQFLKRPRPSLLTLPVLRSEMEFYNSESNIYTLGRITNWSEHVSSGHVNLINQEYVKFQVWSDHLYLERLFVDDLRTALGPQIKIRGKDVLSSLQDVCDEIGIGCHVVDDSNIQLRYLMKNGKTWYERFGFESHIPNDFRKCCIDKEMLRESAQRTKSRFLGDSRYHSVVKAMEALIKMCLKENNSQITIASIGKEINDNLELWDHEFAKLIIFVDLLGFHEDFVLQTDFKKATYKPRRRPE